MSLVKMESKSSRMYDPDIPDPVSYDLKMASVSTEGDNNAKQRRNKKKREGLTDYSEHASMHGISYVFERDIVVISRVFWFITSLTLAALATYWIVGMLLHNKLRFSCCHTAFGSLFLLDFRALIYFYAYICQSTNTLVR